MPPPNYSLSHACIALWTLLSTSHSVPPLTTPVSMHILSKRRVFLLRHHPTTPRSRGRVVASTQHIDCTMAPALARWVAGGGWGGTGTILLPSHHQRCCVHCHAVTLSIKLLQNKLLIIVSILIQRHRRPHKPPPSHLNATTIEDTSCERSKRYVMVCQLVWEEED